MNVSKPTLPELTNASSDRWFAVDWPSQDGRTLNRLGNPVGYPRLHFGVRLGETNEWATIRVGNPERFMTEVPRTYEEFLSAAQEFVRVFEGV
ncbi:hypothetical protein V1227_18805 [Lentzea sp. DG1S-22]|uniref:hypothetical protein n=1 Tax=Lentzea sp. DG1S-22 TaxID=3108822 RepID=UPI002E7A1E88|nr:hypothetical protein [Lentzea sp. DG1S-22]WVH84702.1 hypothetical protein V1227_18805 [Lentzea sp. DG1S-22]